MLNELVLQEQPAVRGILEKRWSKRRNGRKDGEYLVDFAGFSETEAAWYSASDVRNR